VKVVAVTDPTLRLPEDGTYWSAVAVWISAGLPPAVLSFGVRHRYRAVAALVLLVTTWDASDASPVKVGAVIPPVATILGTRNTAPPVSPGVYVSSVPVRRLLVPPLTSENTIYCGVVIELRVVVTWVADDALPVKGPLNDAAVMLPVLVRACELGT
jgi:hypothetical protein